MTVFVEVLARASGGSRVVLGVTAAIWAALGGALGVVVGEAASLAGGAFLFAVLAGIVAVPVVLAELMSLGVVAAVASRGDA
jgi:hypothetical protein